MIKIGLFSESGLERTGGVQTYVRGLYDYLDQKGHEVWIVIPGPQSPEEKRRMKVLGTKLELEKMMRMVGSSISSALTGAKLSRIKEFLAQEKFNLLHFTAPFSLLGWQVLSVAQEQEIAKVATFLVYRESDIVPLLVNYSIGPILRQLVASLDCRIALSNAAKEFAQKMFPGKYIVIPSGVDLERFSPKGEKVQKYLKDDKKNLLFVGRLDRRKGLKYLVQGFAIIKSKFPNTRLIIVGKGPEKRKLKKLIKKLKLEDVELTSLVSEEDLPKYYRTADIAIFPAIGDESLGIVLLEAIASGLPVIATDIAGYREVKGSYFVPPKDANTLALETINLLENESLRQERAQESLKAAQEYSWEKIGGRILKAYQNVL